VRNSYCNEEKRSIATTSTTQSVLWDMFLVLGILTATCCLSLHQAGLNDFNTPISDEYAEGNRLAILFFYSSLTLTIATGLLYRYFGQSIAALVAFLVLLCLVTVVASEPHSIVHFYAFYATLFGAILAPLFALWKLKLWPSFWGLNAISLTVVLVLTWAGTKNWELGGIGIVQRTGVIVALLSNSYVLNHCRHLRHSG
jgi:hypothetical protein